MSRALTIGITTRNRPHALVRGLKSIADALGPSHEVIVFDDGSETPAESLIPADRFGLDLRVIRDDRAPGNIVGRNTLVREARHDLVLLLDDDAVQFDGRAVQRGMDVIERDREVAAIAFA